MQTEPIFQIFVQVERDKVSELKSNAATVKMLPFTGTVTGKLFSGVVAPGGVDTQITNRCNVRHMSARYMLEGTDFTGTPCHIYIENDGWFTNGERPRPFRTVPAFFTDSAALAPILLQSRFVGEGVSENGQLTISFYEDAE